ncbi:VCBS repeat protein [Dyadobacter jejuensis]|uniref:VCBS repeat protein n=1 Tax=Dyadobacter jejuensis TaxID=1082580 RepID=A0A316ATI3_9BACT|nr:VCBS repeat-containing protein [Dyadobacter jejuensis]PWJ60676.1 VCBS repeat protein [Dyadobacter jejuensis]
MRFLFLFPLLLFLACSKPQRQEQAPPVEPLATDLDGKALAAVHCSRCHALVAPDLLPKASWKEDVLPAMGHRLGIYEGAHQPDALFDQGVSGQVVREAHVFPEQPMLARQDWLKLVAYYIDNAPDTIIAPQRESPITMGIAQFRYKEASLAHRPALTTLVKIRPGKGLVFSDSKRNIITFLSPSLQEEYSLPLPASTVGYEERQGQVYLTTTGRGVFPTDASNGGFYQFAQDPMGRMVRSGRLLIDRLQRPVQLTIADLNQDGQEDILACEYGNQTGALVWYEQKVPGSYTKHILRDLPGAVSTVVEDMNHDGLPDVLVLMAQGDEGIFLFKNLGKGRFEEKRLLTFLPLNGSQYIELADFNDDGLNDILYVCGDNADKTPILKPYHGVYIFLNKGEDRFEQTFFYPLNGAYKAVARDFDLDGDLDIAAIAFFPDYVRQPEESFVYLENKGRMRFSGSSLPEATRGRWIVMDAGDIDGDGDVDLALGSFVYFQAQGDTTGLGEKWLKTGPSVVVLENKAK